MNPQTKKSVVNKRVFFFLVLSLISICLMKFISPASVAQSTGERELEDRIPKHLPIKVKLKAEKEKAFKDMKNEKWARDFELEVTNTGDKPIYYLGMSIELPEITAPDGIMLGFNLRYGRPELGSIETKAGPDDIPIKPGETYIFKVPEKLAAGWEHLRVEENKPQPKKTILVFNILSFGDGTGFWRSDGIAVPHHESSATGRCGPEPRKSSIEIRGS